MNEVTACRSVLQDCKRLTQEGQHAVTFGSTCPDFACPLQCLVVAHRSPLELVVLHHEGVFHLHEEAGQESDGGREEAHSYPMARCHSTGTFAFGTRLHVVRRTALEMPVVQTEPI